MADFVNGVFILPRRRLAFAARRPPGFGLNKLLTTTNDRVAALDTKGLQQRTERTLAKIESTLNDIAAKKLSDEAVVLLAELRKSNAELQATLTNPTFKKLPESADAAIQKVRDLVADPKLASSIFPRRRCCPA